LIIAQYKIGFILSLALWLYTTMEAKAALLTFCHPKIIALINIHWESEANTQPEA
jgi:hypothetical protein